MRAASDENVRQFVPPEFEFVERGLNAILVEFII
jgi:hypothetical protein